MLSAFKNFLITFLIAALLFGLVGFFATKYVSGVVTDILDGEKDKLDDILNSPEQTEEKTNEPKPDDGLKVPEGNSFTALFVATNFYPDRYDNYFDYGDKVDDVIEKAKKEKDSLGALSTSFRYAGATYIVLLRADKENREYVACYFSPETVVSSPTGDITLGDAYGRYGMSTLSDYMTAMTGLEVDYRFLIDGHLLDEFIEKMGAVKYDLDRNIYSMGKYHTTLDKPPKTEVETADSEATETKTPEKKETSKTPEIIGNSLVLKKGEELDLTNYSVYILNTFKEYSAEDVEMKSNFTLQILKEYLELCEDMKEEELTKKIEDITEKKYENFELIYSIKKALATDFKAETVSDVYSMLGALEYFDYSEMIYPGEFDAETMTYKPDIKTGFDFFKKYRRTEKTPDVTENDK